MKQELLEMLPLLMFLFVMFVFYCKTKKEDMEEGRRGGTSKNPIYAIFKILVLVHTHTYLHKKHHCLTVFELLSVVVRFKHVVVLVN